MGRMIRADYRQLLLLPPCVDDWIPADHPARFIRDFVDALDLEALGFSMPKGREGRPAYAPDLLLKVWLYGYFHRIRSTRGLEKACYDSMALIWLTGNHPPDDNTLWRFWRANKGALRGLFKKSVQVAAAADLVNLALQAVDGTKIAAQVSTARAWHRDGLEKRLARLDEAISETMGQVEAAEHKETGSYRLGSEMADAAKRRARIQEALDRLAAAEASHQHPREPEAKMMKCTAGRRLAYNAQAVTESNHHLIVAAEATDQANDYGQLAEMIGQATENVGQGAEETVADAGYYTGEELARAEAAGVEVLVAIPQTRSGTTKAFHKSRFSYDRSRDEYICPRGGRLTYERTRRWRGKHASSVYRCGQGACPFRSLCTRDRRGRTVERAPFEDAADRQKRKQSDWANQTLLKRRKEIAELPFARLKHLDGFRRWTVRGLENVRAQWALHCATLNLRILYRLWRRKRLKAPALGLA